MESPRVGLQWRPTENPEAGSTGEILGRRLRQAPPLGRGAKGGCRPGSRSRCRRAVAPCASACAGAAGDRWRWPTAPVSSCRTGRAWPIGYSVTVAVTKSRAASGATCRSSGQRAPSTRAWPESADRLRQRRQEELRKARSGSGLAFPVVHTRLLRLNDFECPRSRSRCFGHELVGVRVLADFR